MKSLTRLAVHPKCPKCSRRTHFNVKASTEGYQHGRDQYRMHETASSSSSKVAQNQPRPTFNYTEDSTDLANRDDEGHTSPSHWSPVILKTTHPPIGHATPVQCSPLTSCTPPTKLTPLPDTPSKYITRKQAALAQSLPPPPSGDLLFLSDLTRNEFANGMTRMIEQGMADRLATPSAQDPLSIFYSVTPPSISTAAYIRRIVFYTHCSPSAFVIALVYVGRVVRPPKMLELCVYNVHRIVIAAVTLAVKLLDDRTFSIGHYARVGGVPSHDEMVRMELSFLDCLGYELFVQQDVYEEMLEDVRSYAREDDNSRKILSMPMTGVQKGIVGHIGPTLSDITASNFKMHCQADGQACGAGAGIGNNDSNKLVDVCSAITGPEGLPSVALSSDNTHARKKNLQGNMNESQEQEREAKRIRADLPWP